MFDKITYMSNEGCNVKLKDSENITTNLMNLHLIFEDKDKKILGEVDDLDGDMLKARFLGEISGNKLIGGNIRKPSLDATIRIIDKSEIPLITGVDEEGFMKLGISPLYDQVPIFLDINNFFSNHFAIFGNTGSGKSCGVSRLFQNMFHDERLNPYKSNIFIFDSSGEYYNAFANLSAINSNYNYRFISTNEVDGVAEKLRLPIYLLNKDDLALLLQCNSHSQLPIIERMLKLALVFSQNDVDAQAYKNHIIAKAIMTILYTNETAPNKRNEVFSILASCSTKEFNLEAPVQGVGYVRKFRECFLIDNSGNFSESVLLNEYVSSFIKEEFDSYEPHDGVFYDLDTLEKALNFTLISEGWLRNEQTYGDSVTLRVRLHSLIVGDNAKYFDVKNYVSLETYLSSLLIENGRKFQIVNINLSDIDDDFAKVLTKIYSRLIFDFAKGLKNRGSIPFHIVLEEAHRYIQADNDRFLFGYNIFERIAKEGRKYGVIMGIITQRPVELSDNVISQCTNFLIFKINHPMDIKYIREMVPHITDEIIEKQKSLQPGTCLGFGLGFRIPLIIKMEMPDPSPLSGNCDVFNIWSGNAAPVQQAPVVNANLLIQNSAPPLASVDSSETPVVQNVTPVVTNPVITNSQSVSNSDFGNEKEAPPLINVISDNNSNNNGDVGSAVPASDNKMNQFINVISDDQVNNSVSPNPQETQPEQSIDPVPNSTPTITPVINSTVEVKPDVPLVNITDANDSSTNNDNGVNNSDKESITSPQGGMAFDINNIDSNVSSGDKNDFDFFSDNNNVEMPTMSTSAPEISDVQIEDNGMTAISENNLVLDDTDDDDNNNDFDD